MTKTLKGGSSTENKSARKFIDSQGLQQLAEAGIRIEDTNLRRGYVYDEEDLFLCLSHSTATPVAVSLRRKDAKGVSAQTLQADIRRSGDNYSSFISISAAQLSVPGEYELLMNTGKGQSVSRPFTVIKEVRNDCADQHQSLVSDFDYYNSYYQF